MKTVWSSRIDDVLKNGHSLQEIGVRNWALDKNKALNALTKLQELEVPVLGGDVCEVIEGILQYNNDNWHCEPLAEEPKSEFVGRSIRIAKQYIETYQFDNADNYFFAIVPGL